MSKDFLISSVEEGWVSLIWEKLFGFQEVVFLGSPVVLDTLVKGPLCCV